MAKTKTKASEAKAAEAVMSRLEGSDYMYERLAPDAIGRRAMVGGALRVVAAEFDSVILLGLDRSGDGFICTMGASHRFDGEDAERFLEIARGARKVLEMARMGSAETTAPAATPKPRAARKPKARGNAKVKGA